MNTEYIRRCPVCDTENPAENTRCACGALLAGVDFSLPSLPPPEPAAAQSIATAQVITEAHVCPHPDCAQPNPPGETRCLYCNRPLQQTDVTASTSPLPPALAARYRVIELFPASGAEADLMLVESFADGRKAMAKLYRKGMEPDLDLLARLADSAHEHVVRIFEHGDLDGVSYELMEYCPLGTLRQLLDAGHPSIARVREIVAELAGALNDVHRLNILHRDLKPENVLVRRLEPLDLVLTDFGISSLSNATQHFTSVARSTRYAPPEALTGVLDRKADWWSLGMIVLEAITGKHPFDGLNEHVINHHLATRSIDTQAVFDADLRMLCRGLLLRDPLRRWAGPEVARWLAGDPTLAAPEETLGHVTVTQPFRIGNATCHSLETLCAGLASYWDTATRDLRQGSVSNWLENQLQDYTLSRNLREILDTTVNNDLALLRFLRLAGPDMPPLWRGIAIEQESLMALAVKASADHLPSRKWLESVFQQSVLRQIGQPALADLDTRWRKGFAAFYEHWKSLQTEEYAWASMPRSLSGEASAASIDVDQIIYGQGKRMNPPPGTRLLPDLLLALEQPAYLGNTRTTVLSAMAEIGDACPWINVLGAPQQLAPEAVLAMRFALPMAREDAEAERLRRTRMEKAREKLRQERLGELNRTLRDLADRIRKSPKLSPLDTEHLADGIDLLRETNVQMQTQADLDKALRDGVMQLVEHSFELHARLDALKEERLKNAVWLQPGRLILFASAALFMGAQGGLAALLVIAAGVSGLLFWRTSVLRERVRAGQDAARQMQARIYALLEKIG